MKKIILASLTVLTMLLLSGVALGDTLYLRDGRTLRGTLIGYINGRFAFRVASTGTSTRPVSPQISTTTRNEGEIQFFRPAEVDRVEIDGRSLDDLKFETRNVEVQLGPNWIDSGIDLRRNERVQTTASGTILAGRSRITPDGLRNSDPSSPLPSAAEGLLIAAIGNDPNSPVVELGSSREFVADRDGRLYLTLNRGSYSDARGSFTVQIKRERDQSSMGGGDNPNTNPRDGRPRNRPRTGEAPFGNTPREVFIDVAGTSRGTDTNIDVRTGDQITFTTTGSVIAGSRIGEVGPEGGKVSGFGAIVGTRPVPSSGPGALIGYIRLPNGQTSQPFLIGSQLTLTVPVDGRLFLLINDDNYNDNSGSFRVKIRY
ncbi:MAG: hypothetical protein DMF69_09655 [Acidobacteria bacterium]|nr:MAG: hypothetical protein DMF69_09655 [Acidobacteriota bacterium]